MPPQLQYLVRRLSGYDHRGTDKPYRIESLHPCIVVTVCLKSMLYCLLLH